MDSNIEYKVDKLIQSKKPKKHRKINLKHFGILFSIALGSFLTAFLLITTLVIPIFDDRRLVEEADEEPVEPLGADDWLGISSAEYDSHCGEDAGRTLADALDGTDRWDHTVNEIHWFILDLGQTYTIKKVRARSGGLDDPIDVNVYVSDSTLSWGSPVATNVSVWQDNEQIWQEVDTVDKNGRYIRLVIYDTEDSGQDLDFGDLTAVTIFDAYGDVAAAPPANTRPAQSGESPTNASTNIAPIPDLYVLCTDHEGSNMNATWWSNSSGSWALFASNSSASGFANNTNITQSNDNFSAELTKYWWSVNLSDGTDWTNNTYHFTVRAYTWQNVDTAYNGEFTNVTTFQDVDTTYNGEFTNTTIWQDVDTTYNGAFTNTTTWQDIDTSINGAFTNTTVWHNVDVSYNGEFTNVSIRIWQNVDTTYNGEFTNVSTKTWQNVNDTINGAFTNTTVWQNVDTSINGVFTNTTVNITITSEYPTNGSTDIAVNTSLHFTVNHTLGYLMNISVYTGSNLTNCSALLGSFNSVANGTYYLGYHNASEVSTNYSWRVNVTDAYGDYVDETYNFTTASTTGIRGYIPSGYGMGMIISFAMLVGLVFFIIGVFWKRKRKDEYYRRY